LSERWIEESGQLLKGMKKLSSKENRDRLEVINSINFALNLLDRGVRGWRFWVGNLSLMSQFTLEELTDIERVLEKQTQSFVEYDIEVTKKWKDKFPQIRIARERQGEGEETRGLYV